jgi:hypothetical protein
VQRLDDAAGDQAMAQVEPEHDSRRAFKALGRFEESSVRTGSQVFGEHVLVAKFYG